MITCVTAPSRSGTSLTMQMLQAAGFPLFWNCLPNRTVINPLGHFEFDWTLPLALAEGKAVKVMPFDLERLTPEHEYRFITILRNPKCIDASQLDTQVRQGWKPMSDANETESWHAYTLDFVRVHQHVIVGFDELFSGVAQQRIAAMMGFDALQVAKMNDCVEPSLWHFKPEAK
jgi:hypothetical protein